VVELRDRAGAAGDALPGSIVPTGPVGALQEARSALEALGYRPGDAQRMAEAVKGDDLTAEQIIREALKRAVR
jgi:Holliday junction DNA helicase RuvA